jgi:GNAT superfamily N-acetyltransferase
MADMLVKLYNFQADTALLAQQETAGITIRKPLASEKHLITAWVQQHFSAGWVSEVEIAITQRPPTCWIAVQSGQLLGFACYDAAALGYFGPMGIAPDHRGQGLGKALLHTTLRDMYGRGYGYAVIGFVGPVEFYTKTAGAILIPDSTPGLWETVLQEQRP